MENLSPRERALQRLRSQSDDDEGRLSPRERVRRRSEGLGSLVNLPSPPETPDRPTGPELDDAPSVFRQAGGDEDTEGFREGDMTPAEQAQRMLVMGRALRERESLKSEAEEALRQSSADQAEDAQRGTEQTAEDDGPSAVEQALRIGAQISAAIQPGSSENIRMLKAMKRGLERNVRMFQQSSAATNLLRSESLRGPNVLQPGVAAARKAEALTDPKDREEEARRYLESQQRLEALGQNQAVKKAARSDTFFGALKEVAQDPAVAIPELVASSALFSAPPAIGAILGGAAGPVGSAAGAFLGTVAVEQQASMANLLADEGVDVSNPTELMAATADPEMRRRIKTRATRRGLAVGAVDALFAAASMGLARTGLSPIAKMGGGFALETAGESTSEAAGQVAAGEEFNPAEVALEGVAGMGQSGATTIGQVAVSQLTASEQRVETELRRLVEQGRVDVEASETSVAQMMQRAIDNGGLQQPRQAAQQAFDEAVRRGDITVERPPEQDPSRPPARPDTEPPERVPQPRREPEGEPEGEPRVGPTPDPSPLPGPETSLADELDVAPPDPETADPVEQEFFQLLQMVPVMEGEAQPVEQETAGGFATLDVQTMSDPTTPGQSVEVSGRVDMDFADDVNVRVLLRQQADGVAVEEVDFGSEVGGRVFTESDPEAQRRGTAIEVLRQLRDRFELRSSEATVTTTQIPATDDINQVANRLVEAVPELEQIDVAARMRLADLARDMRKVNDQIIEAAPPESEAPEQNRAMSQRLLEVDESLVQLVRAAADVGMRDTESTRERLNEAFERATAATQRAERELTTEPFDEGRRAEREPKTVTQRLEALGVDPSELGGGVGLEDVARLERNVELMQDMEAEDLAQQREAFLDRLEAAQEQREEGEIPEANIGFLRVMARLTDEEIQQRAEDVATGDRPTEEAEQDGPEESPAEEAIEEEVEEELGQQDDLTEDEAPPDAPTEEESAEGETTGGVPTEEEVRQREEERQRREAERAQQEMPDAVPPIDEITVGTELVDVGGSAPAAVTILSDPKNRTVRVEKEDPDLGSIKTTALIANLRRPEDVEQVPGTMFSTAEVDDTGRAILTDEYQVIPEHAEIPPNADVRHDLGTSDLPVARRDAEADENATRRTVETDEETLADPIQVAIDEGRLPEDLPTTLFRGYGREDRGEVYRGPSVPVTGAGKYYAFAEAVADRFGPNMEERPLESAENPLVITSDDQWRELTQAAGWAFPQPSIHSATEAELRSNAADLQEELEARGHDALMVWWDSDDIGDIQTRPNGEQEAVKTLRTVFGEPQVFFYQEEVQAPPENATEQPRSEDDPEDLSELGRRTPIRQEQRIEEQLEQVRTELQQARDNLRSLEQQRPEQQQQQEVDQGGLFGTEQSEQQAGGTQPSFGDEFERATETPDRLQELITQQREVVDQLQQQLIELRQQAPDAQAEARRSQVDLEEQIEQREEEEQATSGPEPAQSEQARPPRSAAAVAGKGFQELRRNEEERQLAIATDLYKVLRDFTDVGDSIPTLARLADKIRVLRSMAEQEGDPSAEFDIANMKAMIDEQIERLENTFGEREIEALRSRLRAWTESTRVPGKPSTAHLNNVGGFDLGPEYEGTDGYTVRPAEDGTLEVISPNTGNPIDRRSSRYEDVLVEYFSENTEAIDENPRITDQNPDLSLGEWAPAVASASRNPFEIIEALLVEAQQQAFDPVALRLSEVGRLTPSSLEPYISRTALAEQGALNWVDTSGQPIENVARDLNRDFGLSVSPQDIVDQYILENPGGPSTLDASPIVEELLEQFQSVTGLPMTVSLAQDIHAAAYEQPTQQQQDERGTSAPFEPTRPYIARPTQRRSSLLRRDRGVYRREDRDLSLRELAADGYELRDGEPESTRELGLTVAEQLSLFGPAEGETQGEQQARENPGVRLSQITDPVDVERTVTEATEAEMERMEQGLLGRAITDDLVRDGATPLLGRTVQGPEDLAAMAQILRDPRLETFRFFFVREEADGSETIIHHTAVSSRLPGQADVFPVEMIGVTDFLPEDVSEIEIMQFGPPEAPQGFGAFQRLKYWIQHQMDETGTDGFYIMHNHPSGNAIASDPDMNVTRAIAFDNPGFKGHVIIDSGEFNVIREEGTGPGDFRTLEELRQMYRNDLSLEKQQFKPSQRRLRIKWEQAHRNVNLTEDRQEITDPETLRLANIEEVEVETHVFSRTEEGNVEETVNQTQQRDLLHQPSLQHEALGHKIFGEIGLRTMVDTMLSDQDAPTIVSIGSDGGVRGLMTVDPSFVENASENEMARQTLAFARHTGSARAFLVNVPDRLTAAASRHFQRGIFDDIVMQSGENASSLGIRGARPVRMAKNAFGFKKTSIDPVRVREEDQGYGRDLRDEVRRRVGRLQHNRPQQQDPHPDSGPADREHIRQAAIRVGDDLYRARTHVEALDEAIRDGALERDGRTVRLPDGTPVEEGDVELNLYTTSRGRVVARQRTGGVLGVERTDMIERPRRPVQEPLAPPPPPRQVARELLALQTHEERSALAPADLPETANDVDVTLEARNPRTNARADVARHLNDNTINDENPVSAPQVIRSFLDVVRAAGRDVPTRYGGFRGFAFGTAGVFKVHPEVIRLREAGDVPVAAHEMGHALEKAVFGWVDGSPWQKAVAGTDGAVQDELVQLGKELYGDRSPTGGYKREGWAEFVAFYILDPQQAQEQAPQLFEWFEGTFLEERPAIAEQLERAQALGQRWFEQGAIKRSQAQVQKKRTFWQQFKETVSTPEGRERLKTKASQATLTEFSPLLRVVEEAEARMGESLSIEENPFLTAEALAKTHTARTRMFVEQGTFDFAGNPVGHSLRDAAQIVRGQRDEFTLYLWARRALKLWEGRPAQYDENGRLVHPKKEPRNPGMPKADAQYIFDFYDSKDFRQAAEMVYEWNNDVLDYTKAAFDPEMAERVKGGDVGDYVPLQRVFGDLDEQVIEARRNSGGGVLGSDPIQALKGSSRRIRDPFQAMIEQAEKLIRATHERYILNQLLDLTRNVDGLGRFIERVPRDQVAQQISVDRIIGDLQDEGIELSLPEQEIEARMDGLAEELDLSETEVNEQRQALRERAKQDLVEMKLGSFMTFFKPAIVPQGRQDPWVAVQNQDGDIEWFELSRQLYDTFSGLDIYRLPWYLDNTLGAAARTFRLGTTGIRASFALITNPARDIQVLYAQSRSSQNPASMFAGFLQAMKEGITFTAADDLESVDPMFQRFMNLGGEIARPLGVDTEETRRAVREVFQSRTVRMLSPSNWIDHVRDVFQIPETTARVTEMRATAEEIGWEEGTRMSDGQALQLLLDAKRVTTDFTSQGKYTKVINQMLPFTTANIGGSRAFVRAFQQNPARAMAAAATFVSSTISYWWQIRDEEWYKDLLPRERFNNWFFPIEDGPVMVFPRAFEWGTMFSAVPEALLDAWYQDEPERVTSLLEHMYKNINPLGTTNVAGVEFPTGLPVPFQVALEQAANQKFYFESPIVPRGEERKPAAEQFGPYTSTVAIQVGRALDVSPRRVDHLIAGFLGGVGRDATDAMDALLSQAGIEGASPRVEREQTFSDIPVAGKLFRAGGRPGLSSKTVDTFYERLEQAQLRQASDVMKETPADRQARLLLSDAQTALSLLYFLRNNTKETETRRRLQVEIRRLAQDALDTVDAGPEAVQRARSRIGRVADLDEFEDAEQVSPDDLREEAFERLRQLQDARSNNGEQ